MPGARVAQGAGLSLITLELVRPLGRPGSRSAPRARGRTVSSLLPHEL